jgi:signal transduction histidine kinase
LLLYLEWILLGIAVLTAVLPVPPIDPPPDLASHSLLLKILIIASFGLLGLRLPIKGSLIAKVLYTGLEFCLVLTPNILDRQAPILFPMLYLIIVIRSCLLFRLQGRLTVAGLVIGSFLTILFVRTQAMTFNPNESMRLREHLPLKQLTPDQFKSSILTLNLNFAFSFALTVIFVLLLINALLAERQSREKLAIALDQLRHYALRIEDQATLQERNRIAREIHDSLGHSLSAQSIQLENALIALQPDEAKARTFLLEARRLGSSALQEVRQSVSTLRSNPLKGQSLETAIATLVNNFYQMTGTLPDCTIQLPGALPLNISTAVYRIIQEALTNIHKHSAASEVIIHLRTEAETLHLSIADNGKGFNPSQNTTGFGIQGMQERTIALTGQFSLISATGAGCQILAMIPFYQSS